MKRTRVDNEEEEEEDDKDYLKGAGGVGWVTTKDEGVVAHGKEAKEEQEIDI
jgi:hypothetical protein